MILKGNIYPWFTAIIAVFLGFSDVDDGTIVGSSVFNIIFVIAMFALFSKRLQNMTKRMLNTADPTMVPIPTSLKAMNTPMIEVNSSGADPPAAINVAPKRTKYYDYCSTLFELDIF